MVGSESANEETLVPIAPPAKPAHALVRVNPPVQPIAAAPSVPEPKPVAPAFSAFDKGIEDIADFLDIADVADVGERRHKLTGHNVEVLIPVAGHFVELLKYSSDPSYKEFEGKLASLKKFVGY